jgi:hypothetical protein
MKLPNAHLAVVDQDKITGYLLNSAHPDNGGKAPFFLALGFRSDDWQALAAALRELAGEMPVAKKMESPHGLKYIVDGQIETPGGRSPTVRTIWIIDQGLEIPRLVTAYPSKD